MNPELSQFEQVVIAALSPDNGTRSQAEAVFQQGRQHPDTFFSLLIKLVQWSQNPGVRQFSAVMLRRNLIDPEQMWNASSPVTQQGIKDALLGLFKTEPSRIIRRSVTDAISTLAEAVLAEQKWPELLPEVLALGGSPHAPLRQSAMELLESLCEFCVESCIPHFLNIKKALCRALGDSEGSVQIAALKGVVALLLALEAGQKKHLTDTVPLLFQTVVKAQRSKNEEALTDAIKHLLNIPQNEPTFLRPFLKEVIDLFVSIASDTTLGTTTRRTALEFLLTFAEEGKGMIRKYQNGQFGKLVIPQAFSFLCELHHTSEWDKSEEDDDEEETNYAMGMQAVDRLAVALGGKLFLSVATPIVHQLVSSENWVHRHAALVGIAMMSDGCRKFVKPQMNSMLAMILPFIVKATEHPRVRWAAVDALAYLSVDFAPFFQKQFHALFFQNIVQVLNPQQHPRLVSQACLTIVDFCGGNGEDGAPVETVRPYVDQVLQGLLGLLQCNHLKIQESALTAVAAIVIVAEKEFVKYYAAFMPGLKTILQQTRGQKPLRELRGKAIECVGLVAKAVGKQHFAADSKEIMELLLETQLESDDPQYLYLIQALARLRECLQEDFVPYLQFCIPPLLKSAAIPNACSLTDVDDVNQEEDEDEDVETVTVSIRNVGNKKISINTALMEEKTNACRMLFQYATQMEESYFPYVEPTAEVLIPLAKFFHADVRVAATSSFPALMISAKKHALKHNQPLDYVNQLWGRMYAPIMAALQKESSLENVHGMLESFSECIGCLHPDMISLEQAQEINLVLISLIESSAERRKEREQAMASEDFDEEEREVLEQETEQEDEFLGFCHLVITKLAQVMKERYFPFFDKDLAKIFKPFLATSNSHGIINAAICVLDDIIEHCGPPARVYCPHFIPIILHFAASDAIDLRHSACFGLGACAKAIGQQFAPYRDQALQTLCTVVETPGAREEDIEPATTNAISAIVKICIYAFRPGEEAVCQGKSVLSRWLDWLPCGGDDEEAGVIHDYLAELALSNNAQIVGAGGRNLPKVMKVLVGVMGGDCCKAETVPKIGRLWTQIRASLKDAVPAILSSLSPEEQRRLQALN